MITKHAIAIGDHVEAGSTYDDYDHGTVVGVTAAGKVEVAWRGALCRTTAPSEALRPFDEEHAAEMARAVKAEVDRDA